MLEFSLRFKLFNQFILRWHHYSWLQSSSSAAVLSHMQTEGDCKATSRALLKSNVYMQVTNTP